MGGYILLCVCYQSSLDLKRYLLCLERGFLDVRETARSTGLGHRTCRDPPQNPRPFLIPLLSQGLLVYRRSRMAWHRSSPARMIATWDPGHHSHRCCERHGRVLHAGPPIHQCHLRSLDKEWFVMNLEGSEVRSRRGEFSPYKTRGDPVCVTLSRTPPPPRAPNVPPPLRFPFPHPPTQLFSTPGFHPSRLESLSGFLPFILFSCYSYDVRYKLCFGDPRAIAEISASLPFP